MTIRFFILQSHYASTLDFSNEALNAAHKGYVKLVNGIRILKALYYPTDSKLSTNEKLIEQINKLCDNCFHAMNDDFNTALTLGHIFNLIKKINSIHSGQIDIRELDEETFTRMKLTILEFTETVLGLNIEDEIAGTPLLDIILEEYSEAKVLKNYERVDEIRAGLKKRGIVVKDMKGQIDWAFDEQ